MIGYLTAASTITRAKEKQTHSLIIFKSVLYFYIRHGPEQYLVFMTMFTARLNVVSVDHDDGDVAYDDDDHLP